MTEPRDPDSLIRAFLSEGRTELPDRTYDVVRDRIDRTRQRTVVRPWRDRSMSNPARLLLAAVAIVAIGVVGASLIPSGNIGGGSSLSPAPSPTATPSGRVGNGSLEPGSHFIDIDVHGYGDAGRVILGATKQRVWFTVPAGWSGLGWAIIKSGAAPPAGMALAPWTIDRVFIDPCRTQGAVERGDLADPPLMRTLDGMVTALTDWWGASGAAFGHAATAPISTGATKVTLDGRDARYLQVTTPPDLALGSCDGGEYVLWQDASGGKRYAQGPGEVDRLWVVDVDGPALNGGLLVIDAESFPGTSAADLAQLRSIVDSIRIEDITAAPVSAPTP